LPPANEMALDHHPDYAILAAFDLRRDLLDDARLIFVVPEPGRLANLLSRARRG